MKKCTNSLTLVCLEDDGIYVSCSRVADLEQLDYCDYRKNLGWWATVADAVAAQKQHDAREFSD